MVYLRIFSWSRLSVSYSERTADLARSRRPPPKQSQGLTNFGAISDDRVIRFSGAFRRGPDAILSVSPLGASLTIPCIHPVTGFWAMLKALHVDCVSAMIFNLRILGTTTPRFFKIRLGLSTGNWEAFRWAGHQLEIQNFKPLRLSQF